MTAVQDLDSTLRERFENVADDQLRRHISMGDVDKALVRADQLLTEHPKPAQDELVDYHATGDGPDHVRAYVEAVQVTDLIRLRRQLKRILGQTALEAYYGTAM